ncbi:MAG TPA: pyridoxamine 5'-phosphate oxidase [Actinomycetes bacterium]|jgi:pyridoxamine 5'-phosphate oxidase|nr:pyridoxamine 5'-phosphate oxidase [Actinomycetes bacterium]
MPEYGIRHRDEAVIAKERTLPTLDETGVDADPIVQFGRWFDDARAAGLVEPEAMTLATTGREGRPSARMVLLKGFDQRGFVFYTNYSSRKSRELATNPAAALVFWWPPPLQRQVRIEGVVERVSREESEAYFRTRPFGSQLGAWASNQSEVIPGRDVLEKRLEELGARYAGGEVPLPPFWGGYRLAPDVIEIWQGRPNRLHDRLRYQRDGVGWKLERLSP